MHSDPRGALRRLHLVWCGYCRTSEVDVLCPVIALQGAWSVFSFCALCEFCTSSVCLPRDPLPKTWRCTAVHTLVLDLGAPCFWLQKREEHSPYLVMLLGMEADGTTVSL